MALAFLKAGHPEHPRVKAAIDACDQVVRTNPPENLLDVYSNGLAVIFLCEAAPQKNAKQIEWFLSHMKARQKPHGGWGYYGASTGDTSQSQYGALSYWEANRRGFSIDGTSVDALADWLLRTQGPDGCWGYQGNVSTNESPVEQQETNPSMLAAGLGSVYICADLFGLHPKLSTSNSEDASAEKLPSALKRVEEAGHVGEPRRFRPQRANAAKIQQTMTRAETWMAKNYQIDIGAKMLLLSVRPGALKSFQESFEQTIDKSPKWYNDGYEFLAAKQAADGSWSGYCGPNCDTAFSILFLAALHAKKHQRQARRRHAARRPRPANESVAGQAPQRPADRRASPHKSRRAAFDDRRRRRSNARRPGPRSEPVGRRSGRRKKCPPAAATGSRRRARSPPARRPCARPHRQSRLRADAALRTDRSRSPQS